MVDTLEAAWVGTTDTSLNVPVMLDTVKAAWVSTMEYVKGKRTCDGGHTGGSLGQHDGVRH